MLSACPESGTALDRLETVTLSLRHTAWGFNLCFPPINTGQDVIPVPVWSPWAPPPPPPDLRSQPCRQPFELTWGFVVSHSIPSSFWTWRGLGMRREMSQCRVGAAPISFPAPSTNDPSSRSSSLLFRPLIWCPEASGTAVGARNHYFRQRMRSTPRIYLGYCGTGL